MATVDCQPSPSVAYMTLTPYLALQNLFNGFSAAKLKARPHIAESEQLSDPYRRLYQSSRHPLTWNFPLFLPD